MYLVYRNLRFVNPLFRVATAFTLMISGHMSEADV